ncbi:MAG: peptidylprolyl isomerase [Bacteroidota bacterium]
MMRILGFLFLFTCVGMHTVQAQSEVIDKVIATVGGELVLLSEVLEQKSAMQAQQGELPEDAMCLILDNVLANKLLVNQAKLDSIPLLDEEVEAQLDARIEQILAYMNGDVNQFEAYYGQSINDVKDQFREDLKSQMLAERMRADIMTNISVTPSEVKSFFSRIPKDSLPYFSAEVEVGEIVMKPAINDEELTKALDELNEIRRRILEDGEDFAELASKYSDDFGSARIGGNLGWTKRGKFVPEFEAAAYKLDVDEISPVIRSDFGYHLIQLLGRRGASINTRHILIKPAITDADLDLTAEKLDSVRGLLLTDTINFSMAVKKFGHEEVQSFTNDGRMVNPTTGNTFFEIGDLEPDIFFTIDTMSVGSFSQPFAFTGPDGETYYRIIQLQSRTDPHQANLEQDYSKIQAAAIDEKRSRFVSEWVNEKIKSTYIQIDPLFMECPYIDRWEGLAGNR